MKLEVVQRVAALSVAAFIAADLSSAGGLPTSSDGVGEHLFVQRRRIWALRQAAMALLQKVDETSLGFTDGMEVEFVNVVVLGRAMGCK